MLSTLLAGGDGAPATAGGDRPAPRYHTRCPRAPATRQRAARACGVPPDRRRRPDPYPRRAPKRTAGAETACGSPPKGAHGSIGRSACPVPPPGGLRQPRGAPDMPAPRRYRGRPWPIRPCLSSRRPRMPGDLAFPLTSSAPERAPVTASCSRPPFCRQAPKALPASRQAARRFSRRATENDRWGWLNRSVGGATRTPPDRCR